MTDVRHGGFSIDVPAGWADQSTLLFVAPREAGDARVLQPQLRPTETVSVRFVLGPEGDAAALLAAQIDAMKVTDPEFAVLSSGPFASGLGAGWQQQQRVTVGGVALVQIATATVLGPVAVLATATAAEARLPHVQAALLGVLSSMKAVR
jgi:hypothetical protein